MTNPKQYYWPTRDTLGFGPVAGILAGMTVSSHRDHRYEPVMVATVYRLEDALAAAIVAGDWLPDALAAYGHIERAIGSIRNVADGMGIGTDAGLGHITQHLWGAITGTGDPTERLYAALRSAKLWVDATPPPNVFDPFTALRLGLGADDGEQPAIAAQVDEEYGEPDVRSTGA